MVETTNQKRQRFIKKWVNELSDKLKKPKDDLLSDGLMADDFGSHNVFIEYEDGSSSHFKNAFFVENDKEYGIFTEHCDYHEFNKEWLNKIEEEATLATAVGEINQKLEKIINEQKEIKTTCQKCEEKINKLQEFQEINDMRSQAFYKELNDVKKCLIMLYDKLY